MPRHADIEICGFMHRNDAYELEVRHDLIRELIYILVRGTDIVNLDQDRYEIILPRLLRRTRELLQDMVEKDFVECTDFNGQYQKTGRFLEFWGNREEYWGFDTLGGRPLYGGTGADENIYDDDEVPSMHYPKKRRVLSNPNASAAGKVSYHIPYCLLRRPPVGHRR